MVNRKLILVLFFIFLFSVTNVFNFYFFIPFKAIGDSDVSKAFGTTRNSETEVDEGDNSNSPTDSLFLRPNSFPDLNSSQTIRHFLRRPIGRTT